MQRRFLCLRAFLFGLQKEQTAKQDDGEDDGAKDSVLQVSAKNGSHESRDGGTGGATEISRECEQGKHGGSAEFDAFRSEREGSGPEDADGKTADDTSDESQNGIGRKTNDEIADDTEDGASHRCVFHGDLFAEFGVKDAGDTHRYGKAAGSEKVSRCFIDRKRAFRKGGDPLCYGKLGSSRADHHDQHEPENSLGKQFFIIGSVVFFFSDGEERNEGKEENIEKRNECEQAGEETPMLNTDEYEECRTEKNSCHNPPAIEGMEQAHNARFIFRGAGFDDGADENLEKSSADRIDHRGDEKSRKTVDHVGKERHADESERATDVCKQNGFSIAYFLYESGSEQIRRELCDEVDRDQERDLAKRNFVCRTERNEEEWREIDDDRLRDISDKTSEDRMFMCELIHKMIQPF